MIIGIVSKATWHRLMILRWKSIVLTSHFQWIVFFKLAILSSNYPRNFSCYCFRRSSRTSRISSRSFSKDKSWSAFCDSCKVFSDISRRFLLKFCLELYLIVIFKSLPVFPLWLHRDLLRSFFSKISIGVCEEISFENLYHSSSKHFHAASSDFFFLQISSEVSTDVPPKKFLKDFPGVTSEISPRHYPSISPGIIERILQLSLACGTSRRRDQWYYFSSNILKTN